MAKRKNNENGMHVVTYHIQDADTKDFNTLFNMGTACKNDYISFIWNKINRLL